MRSVRRAIPGTGTPPTLSWQSRSCSVRLPTRSSTNFQRPHAVEIFDAEEPHAKLDELLSETKDEHSPKGLVMDAEPDDEA